ncbi:hypothetical protein QZH41_014249, partial [Actinostola sp. cb2023]
IMYCPRGRVWGGSSSLNAMVYARGHALDYDRWESEGAAGWSYADCLPYFKKAQNHELGRFTPGGRLNGLFILNIDVGADDYRGGAGPLHVSRGKTGNPLFQAFLDASQEAGYPFTDDMNGHQQEGVGWMDMTIHKGIRAGLFVYQGQIERFCKGGRVQACKKPLTLYSAQKLWNMVPIGIRWFLFRKGLAASAHLEAGGFIRSREGVPHPNVQFHFLPSGVIDHGRTPIDQHAYQVHVGSLRSHSKGIVKLKSTNPRDHPVIDFNYMSTGEDWEEMRACIRLAREIFEQKAFDEFRGEELKPGKDVQSDEELDAFIRKYADTAYHPSCTCRMGDPSDGTAVVDSEARVFGVENLRVVDASIMPSIVSGNLNAPTIMMAEKMADHILGNELLPKSEAPVYKTPETGQR